METPQSQAADLPCFRCGECCRRFQVLLERSEARRIADYLGITMDELIGKYADPRWPGADKYLIRHSKGSCMFLRGDGREFLCAVHRVKPRSCIEWAAALSRPECRRGLESYWRLTVDGAGEILGAPAKMKAFQQFLDSFAENSGRTPQNDK